MNKILSEIEVIYKALLVYFSNWSLTWKDSYNYANIIVKGFKK